MVVVLDEKKLLPVKSSTIIFYGPLLNKIPETVTNANPQHPLQPVPKPLPDLVHKKPPGLPRLPMLLSKPRLQHLDHSHRAYVFD